MRDWEKMNRKGFTLIEIVIAVAIVAIFAAAISPMVFRHLEDAKVSKAQNESEIIANALLGYYKDVGAWPVTNADGPTGNSVERVISSATLPSAAAATAATGAAKWSTEGTAKQLGDYMYYNNPDDDTSSAGTDSDESGEDWATSGRGAWRGPYLATYEILDPWGNAYVVNARFFPSGAYSGSVRHKVYVLSAGPDGKWSTAWDDAITEGLKDDDIGTVVTIR